MAVKPGCPGRWGSQYAKAGLFHPTRLHVCPCCWSRGLIADHFVAVMGQVRDLAYLESLWP